MFRSAVRLVCREACTAQDMWIQNFCIAGDFNWHILPLACPCGADHMELPRPLERHLACAKNARATDRGGGHTVLLSNPGPFYLRMWRRNGVLSPNGALW
jgi:hypothetical protein